MVTSSYGVIIVTVCQNHVEIWRPKMFYCYDRLTVKEAIYLTELLRVYSTVHSLHAHRMHLVCVGWFRFSFTEQQHCELFTKAAFELYASALASDFDVPPRQSDLGYLIACTE